MTTTTTRLPPNEITTLTKERVTSYLREVFVIATFDMEPADIPHCKRTLAPFIQEVAETLHLMTNRDVANLIAALVWQLVEDADEYLQDEAADEVDAFYRQVGLPLETDPE